MYRVITFRSRELKRKTVTIEASEKSGASSAAEKDSGIQALINQDGFYTALLPVDAYLEKIVPDQSPERKRLWPYLLLLLPAFCIGTAIIYFTLNGLY